METPAEIRKIDINSDKDENNIEEVCLHFFLIRPVDSFYGILISKVSSGDSSSVSSYHKIKNLMESIRLDT